MLACTATQSRGAVTSQARTERSSVTVLRSGTCFIASLAWPYSTGACTCLFLIHPSPSKRLLAVRIRLPEHQHSDTHTHTCAPHDVRPLPPVSKDTVCTPASIHRETPWPRPIISYLPSFSHQPMAPLPLPEPIVVYKSPPPLSHLLCRNRLRPSTPLTP